MTYVQTPFRQALRRVPPIEGETATAPKINAPLERGAARLAALPRRLAALPRRRSGRSGRAEGSSGIRHKKHGCCNEDMNYSSQVLYQDFF